MEQILYSLVEHKLLAAILGFFIIAIETFIPTLPLLVIIVANSFVLGMWLGFIISWLGSSVAAVVLYFVALKLSENKYLAKYKEKDKVEKIVNYMKGQGFTTIFLSYVCPFIPDFLITITSGFTQINYKTFILGMASGKFVMFLILSYVGEDIWNIYKNPTKLFILSITIIIFWILGKKLNDKINSHKDNENEKN